MESEMSGSEKSDGDSTNHLTEDQLIQKLKSHEMYESNMSTNDMKAIINVLKESQDTADARPKSSKKSFELKRRPSDCRRININSPSASDKKNVETETIPSSNNRNTSPAEFPSDSSEDFLFLPKGKKNYSNGTKEWNVNKSRGSVEPENSTVCRQGTQKWKINPLDSAWIPNDAPLRRDLICSAEDSVPRSEGSPVSPQKAIDQLNNHLRQVAEMWLSWRRSNSVESTARYGSTIKISAANGILDRNDIEDESQCEAAPEISDGFVRKRRSCTIKSSVSTYHKNDDDSDDDDDNNNNAESNSSPSSNNEWISSDGKKRLFRKRKKAMKVTQAKKKRGNSRSAEIKTHEDEHDSPSDSNIADVKTMGDALIFLDDSDEGQCIEGEKINKNSSVNASCGIEEPPETSYPRRIVPPNPTKKRPVSERCKVPAGRSNKFFLTKERNKFALTKERENLNKDTNIEEQVSNTVSGGADGSGASQDDIVELSPNEIDKEKSGDGELRVSGRVQRQYERLKRIRKEEEDMEVAEKESYRIKEQRLLEEKENKIKKRIREEREKAMREEKAERMKRAREKYMNEYTKSRSKDRNYVRTELVLDGSANLAEQETLFQDVELHEEIEDPRNIESDRVPCPICGKNFLPDDIVNHAASCEEYNCDDAVSVSRTMPANEPKRNERATANASSKWYECHVCGTYKTQSGKTFENHVSGCIRSSNTGGMPS